MVTVGFNVLYIGGLPKQKKLSKDKRGPYKSKRKGDHQIVKSKSSPSHLSNLIDSEEDQEADGYHSLSIQVLHSFHFYGASAWCSG